MIFKTTTKYHIAKDNSYYVKETIKRFLCFKIKVTYETVML